MAMLTFWSTATPASTAAPVRLGSKGRQDPPERTVLTHVSDLEFADAVQAQADGGVMAGPVGKAETEAMVETAGC